MKMMLIVMAGVFACSCAAQALQGAGHGQEKVLALNPVVLAAPTMSFEALEQETGSLNQFIGSYPPRFGSEKERELIYKKWLVLVSEAEAHNKMNVNSEKSLYLLSELYRQGHNMDVAGSAEKAINHLDACLAADQKSIPCNFSASYFYLSIGPAFLDKAEKSLSVLKNQFSPKLNQEVEAGFVFLYLYKQDVARAKKQIDYFTQNFPGSSRAKQFTSIKESLGDSIEWKQQ